MLPVNIFDTQFALEQHTCPLSFARFILFFAAFHLTFLCALFTPFFCIYISFNTSSPRRSLSLLCALFPFTISPRYDLGSGLSTCATNSPRTGYYLWGARQSFAPAGRGEDRRKSYGGDSIWKRHSLAPRCRRSRQTPHPRTHRFPAT